MCFLLFGKTEFIKCFHVFNTLPHPHQQKKKERISYQQKKLWPFEGHLGRVYCDMINLNQKVYPAGGKNTDFSSFLATWNTFPYDEKSHGYPICFWELSLFCSICKSYQSSSVCSVILTLVLVRGSWKDICSRYWQACTWLSDDKGHWFQG